MAKKGDPSVIESAIKKYAGLRSDIIFHEETLNDLNREYAQVYNFLCQNRNKRSLMKVKNIAESLIKDGYEWADDLPDMIDIELRFINKYKKPRG